MARGWGATLFWHANPRPRFIPPTRVLSCNPFRLCPPLHGSDSYLYRETKLNQILIILALYKDRSDEEACH